MARQRSEQVEVVVEVAGALRPLDDVPLYRAEMAAWPTPGPAL